MMSKKVSNFVVVTILFTALFFAVIHRVKLHHVESQNSSSPFSGFVIR